MSAEGIRLGYVACRDLLLVCDRAQVAAAERLGVTAVPWQRFLVDGPPVTA